MRSVRISGKTFYYEDISYKFPQKGPINKKDALKLMTNISEVFDKYGIFFMPMWGTLLGIIRNGDFIDHDNDVDLMMVHEDEGKLYDALMELKERGVFLCKQSKGQIYTVVSSDGITCDIDVMRKACFPYSLGYCVILEKYRPKHLFGKYKKIDFQGLKISVPENSDEFLTYFYGESWRIPQKGVHGRNFPKWMIVEEFMLKVKRKIRWIIQKKIGIHIDDYMD